MTLLGMLLLVLLYSIDGLIPFLIVIAIAAPLIVGWQILFDQVQPQAKLAWLLAVLFIPFLGALACSHVRSDAAPPPPRQTDVVRDSHVPPSD